MAKVALISMGCVMLCSRARAIRVLKALAKDNANPLSFQTCYSFNITDMSKEELKELIEYLESKK